MNSAIALEVEALQRFRAQFPVLTRPCRGGVLEIFPDRFPDNSGPAGSSWSPSPVVPLGIICDGTPRTLWLKLEAHNPYGSIKGRTAFALWQSVKDRIDARIGLIESTSGNLGLALAGLAASLHVPFTAVVDPRVSPSVQNALRVMGAKVVVVDRPDGAGGFLLNRLAHVAQRVSREPGLVWPNQYTNPANPAVHAQWTAPELRMQLPAKPMSVLVAVSTGGTLAGFRDYVCAHSPDWELIGVDVVGSVALGDVHGERLLSGIGASRRSTFLPHGYRPAVHIDPPEAVSACLWLKETTGIAVGSSSGALVAAALRLFREDPARTDIVCLCPDGGDRYLDTVYSERWRSQHDLAAVDIAAGVTAGGVLDASSGATPGFDRPGTDDSAHEETAQGASAQGEVTLS
ncbi:pyridoxal-phosphate dependent enzyme [Streptomyces huasconensis]|uniref:pyridoxal-phosphate dependent enzyme n=1 Tax=Streptomyces huasconensis TaxID=1854574 RepID=UPI0033CA30FE